MHKSVLVAVILAIIIIESAANEDYNCRNLPSECSDECKDEHNIINATCSTIGLRLLVDLENHIIEMECKTDVPGLSILNNHFTEAGEMVGFSLKGCSLPTAISVDELTKNLGINGFRDLKISNVNTTVSKDLFMNINTALTGLSLNYLGMTSLDEDVFEGMENLTSLDLSSNLLQDIPIQIFTHTPKLEILILHHNHLKEYPQKQLTDLSLKYLDISFNHIKEFTSFPCTANGETLKTLNVSSNPDIDLVLKNTFVFSSCRSLEDLQISNTSLRSTSQNWKRIKGNLENFYKLHTLNLSYNTFPSVQVEDIVFTDYSMVNYSLTIDLSRCDVRSISISKSKFNRSRIIKTLDLSHNKLTNLPEDVVSVVEERMIEELCLANNNWSCKCGATQVVTLAKNFTSQIKDVQNVLCNDKMLAKNVNELDICTSSTHLYLGVFLTLSVTILVALAVGFAFYRYRKAAQMY